MSSNTAFLLAFAMIAGLLARQRLSRYAPQAVMIHDASAALRLE